MLDLVVVKVFDGVFDLEWLAGDERVESAGDGSGAVIVRSPRGDVRVEVGDEIEVPIRETASGVMHDAILRDELPHISTAEMSEKGEVERLEAYGREHGLAALLDRLGLDGFGNEVVAKDAEVARLRRALEQIRDLPSQRDILFNAEAKALWYIASRALNGGPDA